MISSCDLKTSQLFALHRLVISYHVIGYDNIYCDYGISPKSTVTTFPFQISTILFCRFNFLFCPSYKYRCLSFVVFQFHLRPYAQLGLDRASIPSLCSYEDIVDELISEIPEIKEVPEQISKFWQSSALSPADVLDEQGNSTKSQDDSSLRESGWRKRPKGNSETPCCVENATREDLEITFLGTGSSQPSKYRNVSSIYINLFAQGGMLLDCGEGTLGQLKRRFVPTMLYKKIEKKPSCLLYSFFFCA